MKRFITGSFLVLMSILSGFPVQAGKSLDEIDRESFAAKYILSELPGISMIPVSSVDTVRNREYFSLDGIWLMAEGGDEKLRLKDVWTDAVEAVVPGSVHTALLMNRIIPDPYIGQNDSIAEQQSYKTWWFSKKFTLNEPLENPILSFGGVANRCTVWLNGKKLGSHEGMFGGPDFAVKKYLKKENTLVVKLDPIPQMFLGNWPPNANESWKYTVVFNCVYGWHYAQIPSLGIWRSVKLESQAPVEIEAPFVSTRSLQGDMRLAVTLKKINAPLKGKLQIRVVPKNFEGAPQFFEHEINSSKKTEQFSFDFKIDAPRLWWPNDMGEQSLYDMTVAFIPRNGARPDVEKTSFGIRTIDMAPFPGGEREDRYNWTFVINGKPMFVKGTGWCTMDALMDFSREKYDRLLSIAKSQHIQMMRAWGGGLPETDDFYELCDKYGIMVIQEWPTAWNSHNTQPFDMLQETVVRNMKRVAAYLGLPEEKLHIDVSYTMLMVNVSDEAHSFSKFQKCEKHGINMTAISAISKLSWRAIEQDYSLDEYEKELERISHTPRNYVPYLVAVGAGFACGGFCKLFGCDWMAFLLASISAFVGFRVRARFIEFGVNVYMSIAIAAFVSTCLAYASSFTGWSSTPYHPLLACALFIVPGVPLINFVDDMIDNYLLVGITRAANTVMMVGAMAFGIVLAIRLCVMEDVTIDKKFSELSMIPHDPYYVYAIPAAIAAMGFSMIFNIQRRLLWVVAIGGIIAVCTRNFVNFELGFGPVIGSFMGSFVVSLIAVKAVHWFHVPNHVLTIPSVIPMIPGVLMYRSLLGFIDMHGVVGEVTVAFFNGINSALIILCIALGVAVPNIFARRYIPKDRQKCLEEELKKRKARGKFIEW